MWAPDYPMGTPREAFDAAEEVMFEPDAVERGRGGPTDHASGYPRSRAS
jgi:hypothetical protein